MKKIVWNEGKALTLQNDSLRGNVSFQEIVWAIEEGRILDVILNPSSNFSNQKMYVLNINDYAFCAPFVEDDNHIFLKTVYPSRKYTAMYLKDSLK